MFSYLIKNQWSDVGLKPVMPKEKGNEYKKHRIVQKCLLLIFSVGNNVQASGQSLQCYARVRRHDLVQNQCKFSSNTFNLPRTGNLFCNKY